MTTKTNAIRHLEKDSSPSRLESLHEALPEMAAHMRARKAATPRRQIKTVYWRDDVVTVVNKTMGYELVRLDTPPDQQWFWSDGWQRAVKASLKAHEEGQGAVYENESDFLASLDE